ncbi:hypothetical protein [Bifidobacterium aerophilum]|uniref:hypothetical protein n=1 Tax=Bifidobacterium aerophilum TaxID=1798155 RepID=UPI0013D1730C|nr:hypothetical protein [Bifidobacterium aerophilum]
MKTDADIGDITKRCNIKLFDAHALSPHAQIAGIEGVKTNNVSANHDMGRKQNWRQIVSAEPAAGARPGLTNAESPARSEAFREAA